MNCKRPESFEEGEKWESLYMFFQRLDSAGWSINSEYRLCWLYAEQTRKVQARIRRRCSAITSLIRPYMQANVDLPLSTGALFLSVETALCLMRDRPLLSYDQGNLLVGQRVQTGFIQTVNCHTTDQSPSQLIET